MAAKDIKVGISRDFLSSAGQRLLDEQAWERLNAHSRIEVAFLAEPAGSPITAEVVRRFDALLMKRNPLTADVLQAAGDARRLRLVARNGVGVDHIQMAACSAAGVAVAITPDAVARPVASSVLTMMLAFSHQLLPRDKAARSGRWQDRWNTTGPALSGRTLGVIGLGNIGLEVFRLAAPWNMRHLGCTRTPHPHKYRPLNIELVSLQQLLSESDFIAVCCPLNAQTHRMINASAIDLMKGSAYLINVARGEIVDEAALIDALSRGRVAGAGIDVYEQEPPAADNPLFALENTIVGSHNLAFTDELNVLSNRSAVDAICRWASGDVPPYLVNPEAFNARA